MRILVFQHIRAEHPGIFRDFFAADGVRWDAVELDEGQPDRKSTRLNSSHIQKSRMPSSA